MSNKNNNLLSDSSDESDNDVKIAASNNKIDTETTPKKRLQKKKDKKETIPDADSALFDSDDEDDNAPQKTKRISKKVRTLKKPLSKKERIEALQAKRRAATSSDKEGSSMTKARGDTEKGYDSGDSYDSTDYVRTREDDDFIDISGEDAEAVKEFYAEQHFDDERPDSEDEMKPRSTTKSGKKRPRSSGGLEGIKLKEGEIPDNPVLAAVQRMKKKKKVVKGFDECRNEAMPFLEKMDRAADEDDLAIKERKPATNKLRMLSEVVEMLTQREMIKPLLESDLLVRVKRWIQPLPNGSLGNVTLRNKLIGAIAKMGTGDDGVQMHDLKQSEFGKIIMSLYMHKKETPEMKRQLKGLIEEYSREIFGKSGNMKELKEAQSYRRHDHGLSGISRSQATAASNSTASSLHEPNLRKSTGTDFGSILGAKVTATTGKGRVTVPYSKGFQFTVRPNNKSGNISDRKNRGIKENRKDFHKRIMDRNRSGADKNAASGSLSVEGRPIK